MIRIEYKSNGTHIETKWVQETTESSAMLGRVYLDPETFRDLEWSLIYRNSMLTTEKFKFIEKKDV